MRATERKRVQWSPHNGSQFVVGGNDLRLYEIRSTDGVRPKSNAELIFHVEEPQNDKRDQDKKMVYLMGANTEIQNLKCFDWCLDKTSPTLLGAGLMTGRLVLTNLGGEHADQTRKEFLPKQPRVCNVVAWNPDQKHLVAIGLDKVRSDFSCIIWDVNQAGSSGPDELQIGEPVVTTSSKDNSYNLATISSTERVDKPYRQFTNSEAIVALSWVPNQSSTIAAGTGSRWLRIYDLRDPSKPINSVSAHQKSVLGVSFDPHRDHLLATFSEDSAIKLWDTRKLKDPVLTLPSGSKISQVSWCPTKGMGVLASLGKDEKCVKLWDVKTGILINEQADEAKSSSNRLAFLLGDHPEPQKNLKQFTMDQVELKEPISSFSWHGSRTKLLTVSANSVVEILNLHETIPLSFSALDQLGFSSGKKVHEALVAPPAASADESKKNILRGNADISVVMNERAKAGYSGDPRINKDLAAAWEDQELYSAWNWIYDVKYNLSRAKLVELRGIYSIILNSKAPSKKETLMDQGTTFSHFTSPERSFCLKLCGWGFASDEELIKALKALSEEGKSERAAALAVFHMNIKSAIDILHQAPGKSPLDSMTLKLVASSLAGYSDGGSALWRAACDPLRQSVQDPNLGAIFAFLLNAKPDYWSVLAETEMELRDKIAFACRFLDDERLRQFLDRTKLQVVVQGRLRGLILTGIDGVGGGPDLIQSYINRSGDLQTGALLSCHVSHRKLKEPRIQIWILMYRSLLDRWQLWTHRAKLDVDRGSIFELKPAPQVFLRCNYCQTTLAFVREAATTPTPGVAAPGAPGAMGRGMGGMGTMYSANRRGAGPEKSKVPSCPTCRKPLPRCSVCLLPLNATPPSLENKQSTDGNTWHSGNLRFDEWFTWCQTCKHGGHAQHMFEWFKTTDVCPVSDCSCKCTYLDNLGLSRPPLSADPTATFAALPPTNGSSK